MSDAVGRAIDANDLDELLRLVDAFCTTREWDAVLALRDRARLALERGRQLWPAASYAEYRLALDAPAEYAALVLTEDAGRFAFGPIAEVAASTHTWAELAPHVPPGPVGALAAHERAVRGERVDPATVDPAEVLPLPLTLARWEPVYFVPVYFADHIEEAGPEPFHGRAVARPGRDASRVDDPEVEHALRELVRPWTAFSEGEARVAAVEGDVGDAIAALGARDARGAVIDATEAIALLAWAGSSGGRHGRRRGAAAGRDLAWAAAGALSGFEAGERLDAATLGDAIAALRWFVWTAPDASTGWILRIAVHDETDGVAWALDAVDRS